MPKLINHSSSTNLKDLETVKLDERESVKHYQNQLNAVMAQKKIYENYQKKVLFPERSAQRNYENKVHQDWIRNIEIKEQQEKYLKNMKKLNNRKYTEHLDAQVMFNR